MLLTIPEDDLKVGRPSAKLTNDILKNDVCMKDLE
jgi:hypothetical protein